MWKLRFRIPWQYPLFLSLIVGVGMYSAHLAQHFIKDYQRKRIMVFLSPGFDPLGAGYHILQSEIAVGSGRFFGKGLFSGTQTHLGFLPEQHTDFIFSVIGEEMGFMWAAVVILAFGILAWRAFFIARETQDRFGALIAVGIGCVFAFECVMNIGMVIGILPVTGLALPFVSYGGSHMVSSFIAIGLLLSINFRRYIY
jgi:rod shape determining protein RodA